MTPTDNVRANPLEQAVDPSAAKREELRREARLRLVTGAEEGCSAGRLPGGVYGFTYAPLSESPLFSKHSFHSFEVQKLQTGECRLVVFATPEEASRIRSATDCISVHVYPAAWNEATELLALSLGRLTTKKLNPSREDGNWLEVTVYPE